MSEKTPLEELYKSMQTFGSLAVSAECRDKLWRYNDALMQSLHSIIDDREADADSKMKCVEQTLEEYKTAMLELFPKLLEHVPPQEPTVNAIGKSDPNRFDVIEEIEKFNPYHDRLGRFASASGAASFTIRTKDPAKQHWANRAIEREKERDAAMAGSKLNPTPKKNLVEGLGKEHAEKIEKMVQDTDVKDIWNKYAGEIIVENSNYKRTAHCSGVDGSIYMDIKVDAAGNKYKPPYETTLHESAHSIDLAISRKVGYRYSSRYNGGEFQDTLVKEGTEYIKAHQKKMATAMGRKVSISEARDDLGSLMRREGAMATGDVSDMLGGVTKGKFVGSAGHSTSYWIGRDSFVGRVGAHEVCTEAFAEMFSATTTNPKSLAKIKEVFPKSYEVFQKMVKEATEL